MTLPTIEKGIPMPPPHPYKAPEQCHHTREIVAAMVHGDSIAVPSKHYGRYANAIRERGARTRSQTIIGTGKVRVWFDAGQTTNEAQGTKNFP